jgi:two-component system OmpR family response regulator
MTGMSEATPEARLLVVEDEPNILELLSASLRLAGFEVATATGGLEAISAVQRHRPDLVVLDVMLPDLDGFDVARRLRSGGTRTPVLFLTARDATEDKVRGLSIGGDDYVTKPFSLEEVIARIRAVLRRTRTHGPPPAPTRLRAADLELDEESHEVWRTGERIQLSPAGSFPRARSWTTCGTTTSAATPASSSRTCRTCAARSTRSSRG